MRLTAQGTGGGALERNALLEEPKNLPTNMKSLPSKTMKRMTSLLNGSQTTQEHLTIDPMTTRIKKMG